ncbi:MAG: RnfABCDGE type electron transport complex subunit B [Desulfobacterales bacterium]|jgi:NADPH-dependent glutamate synthase beta subunit-like oxidoreductase|nr:RnfABCDGE type electron transport complex subunit B [Desulfobacterales bacterium]
MFEAVVLMGGLGVIVGVGLAMASKLFYVYVDPIILEVEALLPGANCGGCGLPGCSANAEAIVAGRAAPNSCVAGGPELAQAIAELLGLSVSAAEPDIARLGCYYGVKDADVKFLYDGIISCQAAALLGGGMKVCRIGCLGLGSCVKACPFDALSMGPDGLPVVDEKKCTGCGTCERVCPKHIITLSSITRRIMKEYTTEECTTPCQRACPAGINISEYIHQIAIGDNYRAVQVIKERNPFPSVIGRICPRPCEQECRRQYVDEPVAINYLKRYAADFERAGENRVLPYKAPPSGKRIDVIGGGVQGLSTAFFAARLGHSVTVYEATDKLGGLLNSAIAAYRLPREILDWDIQGILDLGVSAQTNMSLGKEISIDALLEGGADAVFLATGGWDSRLARGVVHAETPLPQMYLAIDWLKAGGKDALACGNDVVIVGTSWQAVRVAALCRANGAQKITIVCRNTLPVEDPVETEGLDIVNGACVHRILGERDHIAEIEYMNLDSGEVRRLAAGTLILESGRFPELIFVKMKLPEGDNVAVNSGDLVQWEARVPYKKPEQAEETGFVAAGDPQTDFSAAIRAIAAGRRGAVSIHQMIHGILPNLPEKVIKSEQIVQNVHQVVNVSSVARQIMPISQPRELAIGQELEKGFSDAMARSEAARCLRCGLVCYEHAKPVGVTNTVA